MGTGEDHVMNIAYVFYIYMCGFIFPLAIIFTCYLKIIKTLKQKVTVRKFSHQCQSPL